jgi:hypothetical protein
MAAEEDARLVGEFCASLPDLQAALNQDETARSVLNGTLDRLRESPDSPAAAVTKFMQDLGLGGNLRTVDVPAPPSAPPQGSYGCPRQVCNRRADREPGGPAPFCPVYGKSMIYRP